MINMVMWRLSQIYHGLLFTCFDLYVYNMNNTYFVSSLSSYNNKYVFIHCKFESTVNSWYVTGLQYSYCNVLISYVQIIKIPHWSPSKPNYNFRDIDSFFLQIFSYQSQTSLFLCKWVVDPKLSFLFMFMHEVAQDWGTIRSSRIMLWLWFRNVCLLRS